ncbi:MAG: hypothetical protein KBF62_00940 [Candidatus Pacebacteria bacterium]|nr:hypothetical protein [Candidatus Paceibacterota bacterium]MBP9058186.1 hypothetical protein [Candidatus Paceibacterota bacterium]MBP9769896.1 hypothetical protein [Candidatus Paceibacterota bacterium]
MFKFLFPIILIGVAVGGFFVFTNPIRGEILELKTTVGAYTKALDNSRELSEVRDQLASKRSSFAEEDLDKLEKLLPDSVENIKLVLEIEQMAATHGMALKNVEYDPAFADEDSKDSRGRADSFDTNQEYGTFELVFTTEGPYDRFLGLLRDLEYSLRIVDVKNIEFSATEQKDVYQYTFTINTYWLKN